MKISKKENVNYIIDKKNQNLIVKSLSIWVSISLIELKVESLG